MDSHMVDMCSDMNGAPFGILLRTLSGYRFRLVVQVAMDRYMKKALDCWSVEDLFLTHRVCGLLSIIGILG